jgi:hypothetical protein
MKKYMSNLDPLVPLSLTKSKACLKPNLLNFPNGR